jgi:hypothetical protein
MEQLVARRALIRRGGHRFESCSRYIEPLIRSVFGVFLFG